MKYLKRLRNKVILLSTIGNIIVILTLLGVIDAIKADAITKVTGLIIMSLVQIGILTNSEGAVENG